jgi:hypothetical protein
MTRDQWLAAALAAADEQLGHVDVVDDQVLDTIADALVHDEEQTVPSTS